MHFTARFSPGLYSLRPPWTIVQMNPLPSVEDPAGRAFLRTQITAKTCGRSPCWGSSANRHLNPTGAAGSVAAEKQAPSIALAAKIPGYFVP